MGEIKTQPVTATPVAGEDALFADDAVAGSFVIEEDRNSVLRFKSLCPCGCGSMSFLRVGRGEKPDREKAGEPTWQWNGDVEKPTLYPSINHIDHWHGWLIDGVWRSC